MEKIIKKIEFINTLELHMRNIEKINQDLQVMYLPAHDGTICLKIN
jgi:hypothetical protein